jgi:hypothetical protein
MSAPTNMPRRGGTRLIKFELSEACTQTPPVRAAIVGDPDPDDAIAAATALPQFARPTSGTPLRQPHALPPVTSH